ncbi:antA/AntB antirepressor family protein [Flavobacterium johnsoniae]|uniref:Phage anti-repressor protein n=1 Tax=Flavobacterium johnsoniae TaxID=986 RepID=A0A1M5IWZ8_FLAJO|nr:antA/AntB antirepressor family protein [Flavobacterium johnsoniae]SHG32844.1 Phage anti-repressor protein [Flavobacterium johnsoniae]
MKQLIKIKNHNGNLGVSARELHRFLETQTRFYEWINRMLEYDFVEDVDFQCLHKNVQMPNGGTKQAFDDYILSIDTAKEIAMIQRSSKGKQARQYFIAMEKAAIGKMLSTNYLHRIDKSSLSNKRIELLNEIRVYLKWGDMYSASLELNMNSTYVRNVARGKAYNTRKADLIVNFLYKKALANKQEILFGYDEMIATLKK